MKFQDYNGVTSGMFCLVAEMPTAKEDKDIIRMIRSQFPFLCFYKDDERDWLLHIDCRAVMDFLTAGAKHFGGSVNGETA